MQAINLCFSNMLSCLALFCKLFQITDLLVNITKHVLKPKHELLNNEEKEKLLKKYNLEEKQVALDCL